VDGRQYLGDFVDVGRHEEPLEAGLLDERKPLVFCSLGTAATFYPHSLRFFQAVITASKLREDWQFVLHVGSHPEAAQLESPRPNLLIRERVPQLTLLRRAAVMVTHGGMNSIMECIHFGVPMVIVPGLRDQPGNATRAVHHGLAVTARMASITAKELVSLTAHAMTDRSIREALVRMRRAITDEKGMDASVQFLETFPLNREEHGSLTSLPATRDGC
jgi:MGT family glycosyltransferase